MTNPTPPAEVIDQASIDAVLVRLSDLKAQVKATRKMLKPLEDGLEQAKLEYQDRVEAGALYDLLENEVVPLFYNRGPDNVPRGWIGLMRSAMGDLCPVFNTNRMVYQYVVEGYCPAQERCRRLEEDGFRRARELARWKEKLRGAWKGVRVTRVEVALPDETRVGREIEVRAWVQAPGLAAEDLVAQVFMGNVSENREIVGPQILPMAHAGTTSGDGLVFQAMIPCKSSGTQGLTVRVLPRHPDLGHPHETGLIAWA